MRVKFAGTINRPAPVLGVIRKDGFLSTQGQQMPYGSPDAHSASGGCGFGGGIANALVSLLLFVLKYLNRDMVGAALLGDLRQVGQSSLSIWRWFGAELEEDEDEVQKRQPQCV